MTTATAHDYAIDATVQSSAVSRIQLMPAADGSMAYDAAITFNNGRVYRYTVEDDATARRWYDLLTDAQAKAATSWGYEVNHAINHGDLELAD